MAWTKAIQKEPPKRAKPRYEVYGVEVDKETFDRLNAQRWLVDGREMDLLGIKVYAHSAEIAEHLPEEAAEAREHYKAIMQEITQRAGGNIKPMKHSDFNGYFEDLRNVYQATEITLRQFANAWSDRREEWEGKKNTLAKDPDRFIVEQARFTVDEDTYTSGAAGIIAKHNEQVAAVRAALAEHVKDFYTYKPEAVDAQTIALINSGIMDVSDCTALVERNRNNATLQRLVGKYMESYAKEREKKNPNEAMSARRLAYNIGKAGRGEGVLEAFDSVAATMASTIAGRGRISADNVIGAPRRFDSVSAVINSTLDNMSASLDAAICAPGNVSSKSGKEE